MNVRKWSAAAVVPVVSLLVACWIATSVSFLSPTFDEVGHLGSGMHHLRTGRFDADAVNPPLVRLVQTAPASVLVGIPDAEPRLESLAGPYRVGWDLGREMIAESGDQYVRYLAAARLGNAVFAVAAIWCVVALIQRRLPHRSGADMGVGFSSVAVGVLGLAPVDSTIDYGQNIGALANWCEAEQVELHAAGLAHMPTLIENYGITKNYPPERLADVGADSDGQPRYVAIDIRTLFDRNSHDYSDYLYREPYACVRGSTWIWRSDTPATAWGDGPGGSRPKDWPVLERRPPLIELSQGQPPWYAD